MIMAQTDMRVFTGKSTGRVAVARLIQGSDLLESVNSLAAQVGFKAVTVQFIGAVQKVAFQILNQDTKQYFTHNLAGPLEILSGSGNVSLKDGKPFAHIHDVVAGLDGKCLGGHVATGTEVYLIELTLAELEMDAPLERTPDERIGVPVWH
jgi:predicted DNA-binding protein with PD1-like motif